ncbi:release factor glutamine methyltransferase [Clostridium tepidiprofundi DSM 19306]|uniref:Release factor glutamine methyltransferase n=1 Tax=Clostridium tepidiprofundi DSM 19306 TaxID=1121338 RepID=A0A151B4V8_9CLOT|nr:peptide chain release factor N(5)-glutamine methyltransferase [Clostridium tepidiprofundi]KYH34926.1 release factor glutamine methyltransferase [Clostridium tepidiprofundi DSM 19306]
MKIQEALIKAYNILKEQNIETYMLDAQLLMCSVIKKDKLFITMNKDFELSKREKDEFFRLVNIRKDKMPVKYILGECEFMGINFKVKQGVLIPRPDTEILVEEAMKYIKELGIKNICDVCCGSGAIGLSIANYFKNVEVTLYDISEVAYEVTKENINNLKLAKSTKVEISDLLEKAIVNGLKFDMIVSNPPYIRKDVIPTLMDDVKDYEPYTALCGGEDGLEFYRKITEQSLKVLKKNGVLAYEIGYDQNKEVKNILKSNGFVDIRCVKDLSGNDRVVIGIKS